MLIKLAEFSVFSLLLLMITPAFADVTSVELQKNFFTDEEGIIFEGIESTTSQSVYVIIQNPSGGYVTMVSDPSSGKDGKFETVPRTVDGIFTSEGAYTAIAFTDEQKKENGITLKLEYDNGKVSIVEDFVLALKTISDKTVEVDKTVTFTASITDDSIEDVVFSLSDNAIGVGATIDSKSGKFIWTPTKSHGNTQDVHYSFDIIVTNGVQEDKENITVTVKQVLVEPEKEPEIKQTTPEPKETTPEPLAIPASFVDETKDPQSYIDRYNNEASYKKWFDDNYSEYDSIEQAVGLEQEEEVEELVIPASFVDETKDPQSYIDRYNNEASYKKWFDDNYSEYDSIEQAVGLEQEEEVEEPEIEVFGECGKGTEFVDGICILVENDNGGGCLIATATFGSEMAPQVQLLREIRDNQLMDTGSGISFMTGFNQLYYSFSPIIADYERENPAFKEMVKIGITPLLASLSIMSHAESEGEVLGYGIGVILMNLGMYIGIPAVIIYKARKVIRI